MRLAMMPCSYHQGKIFETHHLLSLRFFVLLPVSEFKRKLITSFCTFEVLTSVGRFFETAQIPVGFISEYMLILTSLVGIGGTALCVRV
jgi:hypothetical protein